MNSTNFSVLIISHYYPPEVGAPQARLSEMASIWMRSGINTSVITCFPNHPNGIIPEKYRGLTSLIEIVNGTKVFRCRTYATPNKGIIKKLLGHLVFMINVVKQYRAVAKTSDIILVSSPTFFSVFSAYTLSKLYKKPFIFEVRDLWPAVFKDLDIIRNKLLLYILEKVEIFLYKKSTKIVTVTNSFSENIIRRGLPSKKVVTITNGVDTQLFKPKAKDEKLIKSLSLEGKFIVLYLGAHGISHGLESIIEVVKKLKDQKEIHFLFVGDGAKKEDLIKLVLNENLENISFIASQPKNIIPNYYSISDAVLVPLKNIPLFDQFIPSKIFEIMAMKKPIIGSVRGESAEILKKSGGALICEPENIKKISQNILALFRSSEKQTKLGYSGFLFVKKYYDRKVLAKKYELVFKSILND